MAQNGKIFVAYRVNDVGHILASTTKVGLSGLIGVSARTVGKALRDGTGLFFSDDKKDMWAVGNVELVKVGGNRGKVRGSGTSGFLGMKGKDGLLKGADGEN